MEELKKVIEIVDKQSKKEMLENLFYKEEVRQRLSVGAHQRT